MKPASTESVVTSPVLVLALVTVGCCLQSRAVSDEMMRESRALTESCAVQEDDEAVATTSEPEAATATKVAQG